VHALPLAMVVEVVVVVVVVEISFNLLRAIQQLGSLSIFGDLLMILLVMKIE
jgi:hypothetical protein